MRTKFNNAGEWPQPSEPLAEPRRREQTADEWVNRQIDNIVYRANRNAEVWRLRAEAVQRLKR